MDRRRFFREGLRELLRPASRAIEPIERVARELGNLDPVLPAAPPPTLPPEQELPPAQPAPPATVSRGSSPFTTPDPVDDPAAAGAAAGAAPDPADARLLRPPGALPEEQFLSTCSRCATCVDVCPAQCIKLDPEGTRAGGAPYIDVDTMPCVLCTGLECMHHCPTGALLPTPLDEIDMGTAVWHEHVCVRSHGEPCTMCVDHCPVGSAALEVVDDRIVVHQAGCVGCGVCQNNCPTDPKSITVTPRAIRDAHP